MAEEASKAVTVSKKRNSKPVKKEESTTIAEAEPKPEVRKGGRFSFETEDQTRLARRSAQQGWISLSVAARILESGLVKAPDGAPIADEMMCQMFTDIQPRNQIERMLCEQMVMTHAQIAHVQSQVTKTQQWKQQEQVIGMVSKLMADFRKTAMTLKEMRAPVRQFIVAQQANVGQQQIINPISGQQANGLGGEYA